MATRVACKGCGNTARMEGAPPGSLPEGWVISSGAAYCTACSGDIPTLYMTQRMSDAATTAVAEACLTDLGLSATMAILCTTQRVGSPEFVRLVRESVENACALGSESFPAPLRALFKDVLACVQWPVVADRVARARAGTAGVAAPPVADGKDPFSI